MLPPVERLRMRWLMLLAALSMAGCGKRLELNEFQSYVDSFKQAADRQGTPVAVDNLVIEFGTIEKIFGNDTVGICRAWELPTRRIQIDHDYWLKESVTRRKLLIWHELGHCLLDRDHKNDDDEDGDPVSLMNATLLKEVTYGLHETRYLYEMFHPGQRGIPYRD